MARVNTTYEVAKKDILSIENQFNNIKTIEGMNFERECGFALQLLEANDYLLQISSSNPKSLQNAVLNIASTGLSLNPVKKAAYLIPRKGKVCLDISFYGMKEIATSTGAMEFIQADIVYEKDTFKMTGVDTKPIHEFEAFGERGKEVGCYCVGKTMKGSFITTLMTIDEIYSLRDRCSEIWRKKKMGPWKNDKNEMIKKTVTRRGSKDWPRVNANTRMDMAVQLLDESHGVDFEEERERELKENQEAQDKISKDRKDSLKKRNEFKHSIIHNLNKLTAGMAREKAMDFMQENASCGNIDDLNHLTLDTLERINETLNNKILGKCD